MTDFDSFIKMRSAQERKNEKTLAEAQLLFNSLAASYEKAFIGIYYGRKALRHLNYKYALEMYEVIIP